MIATVTLNPSVDKLYLVEKLEPRAVMRVKEVHNSAGGKGLNVARVASLLGEPVLATGFLGGFSGSRICSMLEQDGIRHDFVAVPGETRCCINIRDLERGEHTELLEPGAPLPPGAVEAFCKKYREILARCQSVVISGSAPQGTPEGFYRTLVRMAHEAGRPVLLDASGKNLSDGAGGLPTLMKPNGEELGQLLGRSPQSIREVAAAAADLNRRGIPWVAVSLGRDGALVRCPEGLFLGSTPDIPVVNTVGCGDSMVAAFAVALVRGYPAQEAIRLALAVSTANALSLRTGWFIKEDLDRLLRLVEVKKLEEEE